MSVAYLSMGSNIGDRAAQLHQAVALLKAMHDIQVEQVSSLYETEPVGGVVQDDFLNIAVKVKTSLTPRALLAQLHQIEQQLHRKRLVHWGPRTIDLDIIFFDNLHSADPVVTLPHPEVQHRLFVLVPIEEISRGDTQIHAIVNQMIATTDDSNWVRKYRNSGEKA
ncbi:MAG: 2-amino-4-hydroxy-6-hydroxymethyldihydropteridine diphosphokinase [Lactobacillus sp.]|nr:MAG: 2-amino-4-hydroxy-6-hydroxymethyldihydropteridine diphosphokinase [Lactobacillus sp.]